MTTPPPVPAGSEDDAAKGAAEHNLESRRSSGAEHYLESRRSSGAMPHATRLPEHALEMIEEVRLPKVADLLALAVGALVTV